MHQVSLVLACLAWAAAAMPEPPATPGQYGLPGNQQGGYPSANSNNGYGDDSDYEDANYEFKYDVEEQESYLKFGHEEARHGDVAQGRYYVLLPDGRTQTVEYTADQDGYHPKITYQDPRDQGYGGAPGGQGGYSSAGGASNGQGGYSSAGGRNGYSSGSVASGGRNGYSSSQSGYSSDQPGGQPGYSSGSGDYPGSSGPGASAGYSR